MQRTLVAIVLAAVAAGAVSAGAARPRLDGTPSPAAPEELKRLSLEDLLAVEVTSAAKRPQSFADVPAAISVITAEDIRRSGVRSLPEALRLGVGLHVGRFDSRSWAISARGMNSVVANKMLVLIDGRSVYTPLFSGVFWDAQAPLLEDVERIEVIRGPAATLWGANAVNGVVNVITRSAAETQGGLLVAGHGDEQGPFGALRWGGETTRGHYRVYAKLDREDGLVFADGRSADDPLRRVQGGFRWDLTTEDDAALTVSGDLYTGRLGHPVRDDTDIDGGNLQGRWHRVLAGGSRLAVRGFYEHTFRRVPGQFQEDRDTWDLELQHHLVRGRHDLLWGGGYRYSDDSTVGSEVIAFDPPREAAWVANLFFQDEVRLGETWRLIAGLKLEEYSTADSELLPSLRLAWEPAENVLVWLGGARAVRAPTRVDRDIRVFRGETLLLRGDPDVRAEEAVAWEAGLRYAPGRHWLVSVVAFRHDYDELRSQEPSATFLPLVVGNLLTAMTQGIELGLGWEPHERVSVNGGVTALDTELRFEPESRDPTGGTSEANDPDHHGFLRLDLDLPADVELGMWLRHVGALPDPEVPSYTELDVRLAWQARPRLTLAVVGQNLLADHHPEFGPAASREEVERGVYGQVTWSF